MNKNNHVPGIDSNTRTMGVLRGFENEIHIPRLQPSPPQLIHPPPGYHGKVLPVAMPHQYQHQQQYNPELRDRGGTELCDDEDEDDDDTTPIIESCCFCCNLGIGILLGAISYLIFDTIFLAKKAQKLFFIEIQAGRSNMIPEMEEETTSGAEAALQITSIIFSAFACFSSFILLMSVCLCGVPEKMKTLRFVSRYWMFQIGMNALFQAVENLYNTLPDPDSVFVMELPGIGVPELVGQTAVIITWLFTVGYLFGYFFMIVMILSHASILNRMSKKRIHTFYERQNQHCQQKRVFDNDQQSQLTFTERLSDSSMMSQSPPMVEANYQDITIMSDMTGLDDLYSMRKVPILPPIPEQQLQTMNQLNMDPLLQAQLAMLHPIQKFQFLQQQIQNHQLANIHRQMKPPKKTDDTDSDISTRSKPNSNGHNVRFVGLEEEKPKIECGPVNMPAPGYGPRPPCYVPEWSPPGMVQPGMVPAQMVPAQWSMPQQVMMAHPPSMQGSIHGSVVGSMAGPPHPMPHRLQSLQ